MKVSLERVRFKRLSALRQLPTRSGLTSTEWVLAAYAGILISAAGALTGSLIASGIGIGSPYAVAALSFLALIAEKESIRLSPTVEVSVSSVIFIFAGVLFGPLAAIVVGAAGLLVDLPRRDLSNPLLRWLIWTNSRVIIAGATGIAALAIGGREPSSLGRLVGAVAAAAIVEAVADLLLGAIPPALRGTASWTDMARALVPLQLATIPLHTPLIAVLAYAYRDVSPWSVALFFIPAFAAQRLFLLYREQRHTADELTAANERLAKANLSFATALVATLDARDQYTAGHSAAVAIYARDIAARLGLGDGDQQLAHLCGLVHDIGKIGLPPGLLEKPGPLSLDERRQMEQHAAIGERILGKVDNYREIAAIVRHHHERIDGNGYPDRRVGDQIPLLSRIIAVADAYNAMTSDRPYREAMPSRVARLRLAQAVETQFDTSVVAAFEAVLAGASELYRSGAQPQFSLGTQEESATSYQERGAA